MNRSNFFSVHRIVTALVALAFALFVGTAFFLSNQKPIPETGVVSSAQVEAVAPRSIDLGAGYVLELDGQQGKIIAPAVPFKRQSAITTTRRIDLGAGYVLVMDGQKGVIMAPATNPKTRPAPVTSRIDLGAGYWLEMAGNRGQIIPPATRLAKEPTTQPAQYLGAGYWLIDGQIVQEGSR